MAKDIRSYDFKPGFKHEIEVLSLQALYAGNAEVIVGPHRANSFHVFWFQSGPHAHLVDFKPVTVPKNSFLFVSKEQVQRFDRETNVKGKLILFTDGFFSRIASDIQFLRKSNLFDDLREPAVIRLDKQAAYLAAYFEGIESELNGSDDRYHYDLLYNHLFNFLLLAERQRRLSGFEEMKKGPDLDYLILFRELIDAHFKGRKSVSDYAREMNVAKKRLALATTRTVGKTPKQLADERVVLEAKRLLIHTSKTIKEVGNELGFDEPTNSIKYFRKHEGCTPIEFKEKSSQVGSNRKVEKK